MHTKVRSLLSLPVVTICAGLLFAAAGSASAQAAMCTTHAKMTEALASKFKEQRRAIGLIASAGMMELFVSDQGTWTVILTSTDKTACIVAAGHSWEQAEVQKELTGVFH